MPARTREILEDALRRINQRRNTIEEATFFKGIFPMNRTPEQQEEMQALENEERRIKQYLRDEYGELRCLTESADTES